MDKEKKNNGQNKEMGNFATRNKQNQTTN